MIAILDYGAGNLRSVQNTLDAIGAQYKLVRDSKGLQDASKIILPGVGHFGQLMRSLDDMCVRATLTERICAGVPYLGICLGMQALYRRSCEATEVAGLGIFEGTVERFPADARVPHMGWNTLDFTKPARLLQGIDPNRTYTSHTATTYPSPKQPRPHPTTHFPTLRRSSRTTSSVSSFTLRSPAPWA